MIQITGLTKVHRRNGPPALLDLTFDTRPGTVTALLGDEGAGKTTAIRLMVELERGRGAALFDGRTYRRLHRPETLVGLLPDTGAACPGHPGRRAADHLRMLAAAIGVPPRRADDLLEQTRLAGVAGHRLRTFSPGMNRRLALATALLGDPRALLLDAPTAGLSPRGTEWLHSFLRSFAAAGGTVLLTTRSPQEAGALADRVITLVRGRQAADQGAAEFRGTRLRPEVVVRGPQMARLADLLLARGARVRPDGRSAIAVGGLVRAEIGELAHRHGILLHELADRAVGRPLPHPVLPAGSGRSGEVVRLHRTPFPHTPMPHAPAPPSPADGVPTTARHRPGGLPTVGAPTVGSRTTPLRSVPAPSPFAPVPAATPTRSGRPPEEDPPTRPLPPVVASSPVPSVPSVPQVRPEPGLPARTAPGTHPNPDPSRSPEPDLLPDRSCSPRMGTDPESGPNPPSRPSADGEYHRSEAP
ncbi:ATP-binding cassette domain-containing protein [Kitasatospora sp. NPDC085879]|uniref:ATP-binding cassette domain-containing protein n=1 Tax=Kitasatospora sp. NPDC085879 TaxID=3154769 RepID=UPI00343A17DB